MKINHILRIIYITAVCLLVGGSLFGQTDSLESIRYLKKYTITGQPTSLINGGFRVDFEQRMEGRHWLRVTPTLYMFPAPYDNMYWEKDGFSGNSVEYRSTILAGIGIDVGYKYFVERLEICYLLGGVHYSFLNLQYDYWDFVPFYEDGTTYYRYQDASDHQNFGRVGAIACIGVQTPQKKGFFVDTYIGIGYRYAFYNERKAAFDYQPWGYGFRGFYFTGGFRIGVAFGKYAMRSRR